MRKLNWYLLIPVVILFLVSAYLILATTNYVRYWADDFCSSVLLRNNGFIKSQIIWWNGWTGRYSYIAFLDLFELIGLTGAKLLPLIQIAIFSIPIIIVMGVAGLLFTPIFLVNSPNIIQSFYWMTGSLNYFAPFVFLNFYLLLLFKPLKKYSLFLGFLFLIIATGFSEAFGIANLLFLSFLYIVLLDTKSKKLIAVGFFATVLSLGVMYLAPGNSVRSATVSHPENLYMLIKSTLVYSKWWLMHLLYIKTFVVSILTIIVSAFVFLKPKSIYFKNPKLVMILSIGFIVTVTLSVVGLTYEALNWEPPERVMSIVNNMIILGTIMFAIALFQITNKFIPKAIVNILFAFLVLTLTYFVNKDWGVVKNELKISAESPTYKTVGKLDGLEDNKGWVKSCIIEYYK
jgi:hypothetical protein